MSAQTRGRESGRSLLAEVLRETGRGLPPDRVAARLGMPVDLVAAALDDAVRVGLVVRGGTSCDTCGTAPTPPACAGCPLRR